MKMNANRYYFDITDILEFARFNSTVSGIQRFSLRIIGYLVEKYGSDSIRLIAYHPTRNVVISADASFLHPKYSFERDTFCDNFALPHSTLKEYINNKFASKFKRRFHKCRLKILNKLTRGKTFKKRGLSNSENHVLCDVNISTGDTIVIMGATWDFDKYIGFLKREREVNKVRIVHFVHDLIPLVVPEHVGDNVPDRFCRWLEAMSKCSDLFLVNSRHTKKDLGWFLSRIGSKSTDVKVVPLAHEFVCESSPGLDDHRTSAVLGDPCQYPRGLRIRSHILNMTRVPYVLCVGTIESRKNVWMLANVWKDMYEILGDKLPRLILAGRPGCLSEDFDEFIRGTGALCGHIKICERPLDFELEYLYKRCMFTVFPSYYEGWGLPIGESLWLGKTQRLKHELHARSWHGYGRILDPHSRSSMRDTLIKLITNPELLRQKTEKIDRSRLRSWKQVSEELYAALEGNRQSLPAPTDSYLEIGPRPVAWCNSLDAAAVFSQD